MAERQQFPSYFAIITGPVLDCLELADSAKILFGRITSLADREGYCWASNKYLAELSRCGERTITRLLAQLEELDFIETELLPSEKKGGRERRIYIGNRAAKGIDKIGDTSQFCPEGIAKNGEPLNKIDKDSLYIPPIVPQGTESMILFNRFWNLYPKKRNKEAARRAWKRLNPSMALCRTMAAALRRQMQSDDWSRDGGQYIPYPASWLNGRRWEDEQDKPLPALSRPTLEEQEGVTYF